MKKIKFGSITGRIASGNALGRRLGYPTANMYGVEELSVPDGVYAVTADIPGVGTALPGMANLGRRPTVGVGAGDRVLEFHLFGFSGDIYGEEATVRFHEYIRPEMSFPGTEELKRQIASDERTIRNYFDNANR